MFSGIITDIGQIVNVQLLEGDTIFKIKCKYTNIKEGDSISCSGVCLTATNISPIDDSHNIFSVCASQETLSCTNLSSWDIGTEVNLEQAVRAGDTLDGHIVSGHVDTECQIREITMLDQCICFSIELPDPYKPYIAPKGSITCNGISLTVNQVYDNYFQVNIIPYTLEHTNLRTVKVGEFVNIEIDILSRYIVNALKHIV